MGAVLLTFFNFGKTCKDGLALTSFQNTVTEHSIYWLSLVSAFLLGLSYSGINTQIYTFIRRYYPDKLAAGFSVFKFFQSVFVATGFYWFSGVDLQNQCLIMIGFVLASCSCFYRLLKHVE